MIPPSGDEVGVTSCAGTQCLAHGGRWHLARTSAPGGTIPSACKSTAGIRLADNASRVRQTICTVEGIVGSPCAGEPRKRNRRPRQRTQQRIEAYRKTANFPRQSLIRWCVAWYPRGVPSYSCFAKALSGASDRRNLEGAPLFFCPLAVRSSTR